jgi:hypothetical protein
MSGLYLINETEQTDQKMVDVYGGRGPLSGTNVVCQLFEKV